MEDKGGVSTAPPLPKRPPSVVLRPKQDDAERADGPLPARVPPPRPSSKPPAPPQRPNSLPHTGATNGTDHNSVPDQPVPKLPAPPARHKGAGKTPSTAAENRSGSTKKRPEITIVSARPMSQVGFRQEVASSNSGLSPPVKSESPKPDSSEMPNVPPPRPKSVASPIGAPAHPKLPGRPSRPNNVKPADASSKEPSANLIDLSEETVTVNPPVPKPRPRPTARSNVSSPENGSAEPTLPSPIKPTRPTIIRPKAGQTDNEEPVESGSPEDQSGPKLPSYIHTTPSNDASVNELKAAFEKRRSGMNHPAPAPKPKPKPSIAQKPGKPSNPVTGESKVSQPDTNSGLSAEERLMANINDDLSGGDPRSSPTAPSRRKRPTIIRAGVVPQEKGDDSDTPEKVNESVPGKGPPPAVKSPVGRPQSSPTLPRKELFQDDQKSSLSSSLEGVQKSAPARPKPAARKVTPPGPPKSASAHDLGSAQLSATPQDSTSLSVTPPPRKRKTGPPRPAQHPSLSGSLSQSSLSSKTDSSPALSPDMDPSSDQKPSRPRGAPPSRPQAPSKPPGPKVTPPQTDTPPPGSSRKVIIHEVYPQSEAPKLPPRPGPGHPLFHYMMDCPYGIAIATHDYQSLKTDELSFNERDLLVLLRQVDSQWYYGKNGELEGLFPANFVQVVEPLSAQGVHDRDKPGAGANVDLLMDFGDGVDQDTGTGPRCQARFDYEGEGSGDLSFTEGEIITLIEQVGDDWFKGELKGRTGIFPSTFVEVIEDLPSTPRGATGGSGGPSPGPSPSQSNSGVGRTAMYAFRGEEGELSFKAGDTIQLLSYVNSDWLFGEANGKQGRFPSAFIDNLPLHLPQYVGPKFEQKVSETVLEETEEAPAPVTFEEKVEEKAVEIIEEPRSQTPESDGVEDGDAYCIAIHDFTGQTDEDLSFRAADKIVLLEHVSDEWLKGRLETSDKVGIFPAAYVMVIKDLKKKASPNPKGKSETITKTKVKALYDFTGEDSQELSFKEGEVFLMHGPTDSTEEWRTGEINGQIGLFPFTFVDQLGS